MFPQRKSNPNLNNNKTKLQGRMRNKHKENSAFAHLVQLFNSLKEIQEVKILLLQKLKEFMVTSYGQSNPLLLKNNGMNPSHHNHKPEENGRKTMFQISISNIN
jgi:hypothetical protein